MARRVQGNPFARAAVEMALWDLNGRALGVPVHRLLGGRVRDRVPLSWSLAVTDPAAEIVEARSMVARGHRIFKIKTGAHSLVDDLRRVESIRAAVGPDVSLRVMAPINTRTDSSATQQAYLAANPNFQTFTSQVKNTPTVSATAGCVTGAMTAIRTSNINQLQAAFSGSKSIGAALDQAAADAQSAIKKYQEQVGQ